MKLEGRVAIVTGAAQGIGRAIAEKLHAEGAQMAVADLNGDGARAVARRSTGSRSRPTSRARRTRRGWSARRSSASASIDVLVNAAAIVPFVPWDEVDFAYWRKIISVNLDGAYLVSRAVEEPMREAGYGRIVHIASNAFYAGTPNMGPYLAAKGGVVGLTRALATELGKYGITANAVAPGITRTEGALATPHKDAFDFVQMLQAIPRHGLPADIAPGGVVPGLGGVRLGHRPGDRRRRRSHPRLMAALEVTRAGAILAVADVPIARSRSTATGSASRSRRSTTTRRTRRSCARARGCRSPSRGTRPKTGRA